MLAAALGGLVVTTFPISVFSLALPQLETEFHASLDAVTWVITAPLLGFAVALPALGRISDLFGTVACTWRARSAQVCSRSPARWPPPFPR